MYNRGGVADGRPTNATANSQTQPARHATNTSDKATQSPKATKSPTIGKTYRHKQIDEYNTNAENRPITTPQNGINANKTQAQHKITPQTRKYGQIRAYDDRQTVKAFQKRTNSTRRPPKQGETATKCGQITERKTHASTHAHAHTHIYA